MLVTNKRILDKADKGRYAVGHFNISNLEVFKAVLKAGIDMKSPLIIATSEGGIDYGGIEYLSAIVKIGAEQSRIPISLHLDHGKSIDYVKACIRHGYTSVMIDGSALPYRENVAITKRVVSMCCPRGISVEAELGQLKGVEDKVSAEESIYTDPEQALDFVKKTGCDQLAVAVGTSHGAYKFEGRSNIDIFRIRQIKRIVKIPLVLHGGSGVPAELVEEANKYGARLGSPRGVSDSTYRKAVKAGISKINIDTDLRLGFDAAVRKFLKENPEEFDPRKILSPSSELITRVVKHKIMVFGSSGKA